MLKIQQVAKRTGVTVRALHHYDAIGLLRPAAVTEAGYRLYNDEDLSRLQEILFFRELDFPLAEIKTILQAPGYDRTEALAQHRKLLALKRARLDGLIDLVDQTLKGRNTMEFKAFDQTAYDQAKAQYAEEAKARWGDTEAYRQSAAREKNRAPEENARLAAEGQTILAEFGRLVGSNPAGAEAQALVARWQNHICTAYYDCGKEMLACLGQMYVADERFTQNIDQNGPGTAAFLAQAIEAYCK